MADRGYTLLPAIRQLALLLGGFIIVTIAITKLTYNNTCTSLGGIVFGGTSRYGCSFWDYYLDPFQNPFFLPIVAGVVVLVLLYAVRLILLLAGVGHDSMRSPGRKKDDGDDASKAV